MKRFLIISIISLASIITQAQVGKVYSLPAPNKTGGMPLMQALNERKTTRQYVQKGIPKEILSSLLWASFGVNRDDGKRTAPSARNNQEIDIYVCTKDGVFLYKAETHTLVTVSTDDIRAITGTQDFVKDAAINLLLVANYTRIKGDDKEKNRLWAHCDAGYISQNIYLFCTSEGLGTVARGLFDAKILSPKLGLTDSQEVILAQTVGWGAVK